MRPPRGVPKITTGQASRPPQPLSSNSTPSPKEREKAKANGAKEEMGKEKARVLPHSMEPATTAVSTGTAYLNAQSWTRNSPRKEKVTIPKGKAKVRAKAVKFCPTQELKRRSFSPQSNQRLLSLKSNGGWAPRIA